MFLFLSVHTPWQTEPC